MKNKYFNTLLGLLLICAVTLVPYYLIHRTHPSVYREDSFSTSKTEAGNKNVIIVIPKQKTDKINSFLNQLSSVYNVTVISDSEIGQYIGTLKKQNAVLLTFGNEKDSLRKLLSVYGVKFAANGNKSKTTYYFKKGKEVNGKETLTEEGTIKPTLYGVKILEDGVVSEFEQASNLGPTLNKSLKSWIGGTNNIKSSAFSHKFIAFADWP